MLPLAFPSWPHLTYHLLNYHLQLLPVYTNLQVRSLDVHKEL